MRNLVGTVFFWILLLNQQAFGQKISLSGLSYLGIANTVESGYFYDGGGFELGYRHSLGKGEVLGGLEYRMINWGNQVTINLGYNFPYWTNDVFTVSGATSAQIGWGLFNQKALAVWGAEYLAQLEWQSPKRFFAILGIGFRFNHSPAYSKYGAINWTLNLPVKLGIGFRLGKG